MATRKKKTSKKKSTTRAFSERARSTAQDVSNRARVAGSRVAGEVSRRAPEVRRQAAETARDVSNRARATGTRATGAMRDAYNRTADTVRERGPEVQRRVTDTARDVSDKARAAGNRVADEVRQRGPGLRDRAASTAGRVRDAAGRGYESVRGAAGRGYDNVRGRFGRKPGPAGPENVRGSAETGARGDRMGAEQRTGRSRFRSTPGFGGGSGGSGGGNKQFGNAYRGVRNVAGQVAGRVIAPVAGIGGAIYSAANPERTMERGVGDTGRGRFTTGTLRTIGDAMTGGSAQKAGEFLADSASRIREAGQLQGNEPVVRDADGNFVVKGARGLLEEAAGANMNGPQSGTLRTPSDARAPAATADASIVGQYGANPRTLPKNTGFVRGPRLGTQPVSGTPEEARQSTTVRDAERLRNEGVQLSGDGLYSSMSQIGLNQGRIRQRNINRNREDRLGQENVENQIASFKAQTDALNAATGAQNATREDFEAGRLLSQDLSDPDPGIQGRAARTALQEVVTNGFSSPRGTVALSYIINEIDKGSQIGIYDRIRAALGRDTSLSNDPTALFTAAGLALDKNGDVTLDGHFISDLEDVDPVVGSFLRNDLNTVKGKTVRDPRG